MNPIQMLALAAGAFFLLKHFSSQAELPLEPRAPNTPSVDPPAASTSAPVYTPTAPDIPVNSAQERYYADPGFADALHRNAAYGYQDWVSIADTIPVQFNIDQWNYIRETSGKQPISTDDMERLLFGRDRSELLLASEYHQRLQSAGLGRVPTRFMHTWRAV